MPAVHLQPLLSTRGAGVKLSTRQGFLGLDSLSHWALREVDLSVNQGEVVGVIGRNGSGKTTLLQLLAGIISPDCGRVTRRRGLRSCLLRLQAGFQPDLTGRQNAVLSGMLLGMSRRQIEAHLPAIKNYAELSHWFDRPISAYSSGMRARLGFALAINVRSDLLLIDEALSVGDERFKRKSRASFQEMIESERTIILVSNSPRTIADMTDRAIWLENGRTVFAGDSLHVAMAYRMFSRHARSAELSEEALDKLIAKAIDVGRARADLVLARRAGQADPPPYFFFAEGR